MVPQFCSDLIDFNRIFPLYAISSGFHFYVVSEADAKGQSRLHIVVIEHGNVGKTRRLVSAGYDLSWADINGWTVEMWVKYLLENPGEVRSEYVLHACNAFLEEKALREAEEPRVAGG